jgi:hypothetical protein
MSVSLIHLVKFGDDIPSSASFAEWSVYSSEIKLWPGEIPFSVRND